MNSKPNILMLGLDTLRADHLGCYGYDRPTSPFIDKFAERSVLFERCISHAPWTIPSFTSVMSGLDPIRSKVVASPWNVPNYKPVRFDDTAPVLAEVLRDAGYFTLAIDNLLEMGSHPSWFVRGFHEYINLTDSMFLRHHHVLAEQVTDRMLSTNIQALDGPWFAFLHYWDPHLPYNYPKRYDAELPLWLPDAVSAPDGRDYLPRRGYADEISGQFAELIAQYDRSILYLDNELERLFSGLEMAGALENTIVVMFGDHGEAMVEHQVLFEHSLLYEPTVHVPMIVRDFRSGVTGRIRDLVQHHDVAPTLMALCGIEADWLTTGAVMPPFGPNPNRRFTVSIQDGGAAMRALRNERWKLIKHYDPRQSGLARPAALERVELYDLEADPFELDDISERLPDQVAALSAELEAWRLDALGPTEPDPLLDSEQRVDFNDYPGDPELAEFYRGLVRPGAKK
ncbi:sulfatase [Marinobacter sp. P4B1]|uniref:sulfatase n=1 Tax=Marinobacter sp. P4B1 TaxID=1119533 RepID=UPI00071E6276|nr:sulfatase [Marinobacter sp. P4B1]KRW82223.1 hypothetical protein AQ621_11460 [Marinobacter sp. P4B1]